MTSIPLSLSLNQELQILYQVVWDLRSSQYIEVATFVAMIYDILITLTDEVELMWKAKWSPGKLLYFCARYPVAIEGILWLIYAINIADSANFCRVELYTAIWANLLFLIPCQIIIIGRSMALWEKRRWITFLLGSVAATTDLIIFGTLIHISRKIKFAMDPLLIPILGCSSGLFDFDARVTLPIWGALLFFDTVIFILTFSRAYRAYRSTRTRLIEVLIRDGFVYYTFMLLLTVANILFLTALPPERGALQTMFTPVMRATFSIVGSRIMLNLRGVLKANQQYSGRHATGKNVPRSTLPEMSHSG